MNAERQKELLLRAAQAFNEGRDPFSTDILADNHVTLDECMWLSNMIATILFGYIHATKETRDKVFMVGLTFDLGDGAPSPAQFEAAVQHSSLLIFKRGTDAPKNSATEGKA